MRHFFSQYGGRISARASIRAGCPARGRTNCKTPACPLSTSEHRLERERLQVCEAFACSVRRGSLASQPGAGGSRSNSMTTMRFGRYLYDPNDLRAALSAPGAHDRMNASTARAYYVECASHGIGLARMALLCRLIFDHHNRVHGGATTRPVFPACSCLEGNGMLPLDGYGSSFPI